MDNDRIRSTIRGALHLLVALLFWCLFGYWWRKVLPQTAPEDIADAVLLIALSFLGTAVLTLAWVRHNLRIFRRKGPRMRLPDVSEEYGADRLGAGIDHPGNDFLRRSRVLTVSREGNRKRFRISPEA